MTSRHFLILAFLTAAVCVPAITTTAEGTTRPTTAATRPTTAPAASRLPLVFTGGHDLGREDFGRPCALMGAALGVETEVFRKAFSGVTPARGRGPSREEAQRNKDALLKVLSPHGVTNERLDEVANYYRFRPQQGELWPTVPAEGYAEVEGGQVKRVVITAAGSGYNVLPAVTVHALKGPSFKVTLAYGKDLKSNGSVAAVETVR